MSDSIKNKNIFDIDESKKSGEYKRKITEIIAINARIVSRSLNFCNRF